MAPEPIESIVLPYVVRRSGAALVVPVGGSESLRFDAMIEYFPWRGLALTVVLLSLWSIALLRLDWPGLEWAWIVSLVVGLGACVSELASKRDRITREGIERRSGLFGLRRKLVTYGEIEFVKVEEPGRGSRFDVGTLVIRLSGGHERLVAIAAPYEVARIIEQGRKSVTSAQHPAV
jgi:hypothetical protein